MGYVYYTGNIYFITCRTIGAYKFFVEDYAKQIIKLQIRKAQKKFGIKIYGYVILSNHYHILIKSSHWRDVPKFLQIVNGGSTFLLNRKQGFERRGMWNERWAKQILTEKSFFNVLGYILGNPYKHGLVKNLLKLYQYGFSSYQELVKRYGLEYIDNLILNTIALDIDLETEEAFVADMEKVEKIK
ncbi:transposase [Candidatus Kuenenbacteria bacterium]|nr:transposase [Candidatus Kuenenbacteria bacterium]